LAYQNKAWLLATCPEEKIRDGKTAIAAAQKAGELREWKAITDIKSLAAAYAETGDFEKAIEWQKKAIEMAQGESKSGEEEMLKLYEAKSPFRFAPPAAG
jgi:tetratricopeptide (TPR) repeat protein